MKYVWFMVLFALGMAMLLKPELLWTMEHIFTVKNGEPTEFYLIFMRMGGLFFVAFAVICVISVLISSHKKVLP